MHTRTGSFRLFRIAGIEVFLHWSWFVVAIFEINSRRDSYSSLAWNAAEYVALFIIVLLHEFGHALACRQVGGRADGGQVGRQGSDERGTVGRRADQVNPQPQGGQVGQNAWGEQ